MLGGYKILDKTMECGKIEYEKGRHNIKKTDLWDFIIKIDPKANRESLIEVINVLDARGWLFLNNETEIKFDPASFDQI